MYPFIVAISFMRASFLIIDDASNEAAETAQLWVVYAAFYLRKLPKCAKYEIIIVCLILQP